MNVLRLATLTQAAFAAALLASGVPARALPLGAPTLVVSNAVNNNVSALAVAADPRNNISYFQAYWDVDTEQRVEVLNVPPIYGNSPGSWSVYTGTSSRFTRAVNTADPLALDATSVNEAKSSGGQPAGANTGATARTWYVLTGGSGDVSLRVDVAFQGQMSASGATSATNFTHQIGVLSDPADLGIERVLVTNGGKGQGVDCGAFGQPGTIANRCEATDGDLIINDIIRSNPFTVTFDVPFRLSLSVATNASTGDGWALSDFSDPRLATSGGFPAVTGLTAEGFILDVDGDWQTTSDLAPLSGGQFSYSISAVVPEPGILALLGLGLAGLAVSRRRKQ